MLRTSQQRHRRHPVTLTNGNIWLRLEGDYDNDCAQYAYSLNGKDFTPMGLPMKLTYQLCTFQGSRTSLFAFNHKGENGGYALFDNFTVEEPMADRSGNIPFGKTFRMINLANGRPAKALPHGLMHDSRPGDKSEQTQFTVEDRGQGQVALKCADGRYVRVAGHGIPGDVRFTPDADKATVFMWQDYLDGQFMLMSMDSHTYLGISPTTGSSYSCDFKGPDPARRNGSVFRWEAL